MKTNKPIENWIQQKKLDPDTSAVMDSRILMDSYVAMPSVQEQPRRSGYKRFFTTFSFKFTAAAVLVFMAFAGWGIIDNSDPCGTVLAQAYQKVQLAKCISYRNHDTQTYENEQITADAMVWISADYGMKMELTGTIHHLKPAPKSVIDQNSANANKEETESFITIGYILPGKRQLTLYSSKKEYLDESLDVELFPKYDINNPQFWIKEFIDSPHASLGHSVINGIEVEGIESSSLGLTEDVLGRIWIDIKTGLPVQIERQYDNNLTTSYDFRWNEAIDRSVFEPNIPADYKACTQQRMPQTDLEEFLIRGLQRFAETANRYPENLKPSLLKPEAIRITQETKFEKALGPIRHRDLPQEQMKWIVQYIEPIKCLGMTYNKLLRDKKEPVYYKSVKPGDANSILLRWKNSETTYKVIKGDLSLSEISAEQLKKVAPATE